MPQMTLYAPDITCDHCIATISRTVDGVAGARFVSGDESAHSFVVELDGGAVLDAVSAALTEEGYPLGEATAAASEHGADAFPAGWTPEYTVTKSDAGADLNYACPCSCDAGFALDRSQSEQSSESCCCGRHTLAGPNAEQRLRASLDGEGTYRIDVQQVTMPWGQPIETAMAIPESQ